MQQLLMAITLVEMSSHVWSNLTGADLVFDAFFVGSYCYGVSFVFDF
jgi:hypothetical protein